MSEYRRLRVPGGWYFFTVVTHRRREVFTSERRVGALRDALRREMTRRPFEIDAFVVLPDHLHTIWRLPEGDTDFSPRWREIKKAVSKALAAEINGPVWQRRFWEHVISDNNDWRRHMDYIHHNPVKHEYVSEPSAWPWSSLASCVRKGWYSPGWGAEDVSADVRSMSPE